MSTEAGAKVWAATGPAAGPDPPATKAGMLVGVATTACPGWARSGSLPGAAAGAAAAAGPAMPGVTAAMGCAWPAVGIAGDGPGTAGRGRSGAAGSSPLAASRMPGVWCQAVNHSAGKSAALLWAVCLLSSNCQPFRPEMQDDGAELTMSMSPKIQAEYSAIRSQGTQQYTSQSGLAHIMI